MRFFSIFGKMFKYSLRFFNLVPCKILPKYSIQWPNTISLCFFSFIFPFFFFLTEKFHFPAVFLHPLFQHRYELFRFFPRSVRSLARSLAAFVHIKASGEIVRKLSSILCASSTNSIFSPLPLKPYLSEEKKSIIQCKFCLSISYNAMHRCST